LIQKAMMKMLELPCPMRLRFYSLKKEDGQEGALPTAEPADDSVGTNLKCGVENSLEAFNLGLHENFGFWFQSCLLSSRLCRMKK
jgi:hypothetical protein